jgi:FkbM family methyltransferase
MVFTVAPGEPVQFWWSYVPMADHADRTLCEYWGDDVGDLRFVWQFLTPGDVFFDIGAYHGIFSLVAAKRLGTQGQIVAFEPSQRERRRFQLHMRWNDATLKFFTVASGYTTMNSLKKPPINDPLREIDVEAISLDRYLEQRKISRLDLMKIDVEGGEIEAFRGAAHTLEVIRPIVICEVLDWVSRSWGHAARDVVSFLREREYEWFDFRDDGSICTHEPRDEYPDARNYLAVPIEKLALVERWRR